VQLFFRSSNDEQTPLVPSKKDNKFRGFWLGDSDGLDKKKKKKKKKKQAWDEIAAHVLSLKQIARAAYHIAASWFSCSANCSSMYHPSSSSIVTYSDIKYKFGRHCPSLPLHCL